MAPRANPTRKRLDWVAKTYPQSVWRGTIMAFAEATAMHGLQSEAQRLPWTHDGPARLREAVDIYMKTSEIPEVRAGHTRYDRHLPWVARELSRDHKHVLRKLHNRARSWPKDAPARRAVLATSDAETILELVRRSPGAGAKQPGMMSFANQARQFVEPFRLRISDLVRNFRVIVDWVEAEGIDLGEYSTDEAIYAADVWLRRVEEEQEIDCAALEGRTVYEWPDGWRIVELTSNAELECEGQLMRHCVGDYDESQLAEHGGTSRIFSLRDPRNKPKVTMEWETENRVVPGHGFSAFANQRPSVDLLSRMLEFRLACPIFVSAWRPVSPPSVDITNLEGWEGTFRIVRPRLGGGSSAWDVEMFGGRPYPHSDVRHAYMEGQREYEEQMLERVEEFAQQNERELGLVDAESYDAFVQQHLMEMLAAQPFEIDVEAELYESRLDPDEIGDLQWTYVLAGGTNMRGKWLRTELKHDDTEHDEMLEALADAHEQGYSLPGVPGRHRQFPLQRGELWRWQSLKGADEPPGRWLHETIHPPGRVTGVCLRAS